MLAAHIPRKRFGQHFLTDASVIEAIVAAIAPRRDDNVIEIGPGLGALTRPLAARLDHMHAIELDRDIVAQLQQDSLAHKLTIHAADALRFDFAALAPAGARLRIVGNLPYNISTPLLFHLAGYANIIEDLHLMLQKEVVERMVAAPSTSDYGRLSVMLQHRFAMEKLFDVPAAAFRPPPKVESAVIRVRPLPDDRLRATDETVFGQVVAAAFSQRRKMLRNTLRTYLAGQDFAMLGIDPGARAENLTLDDFIRLANSVAKLRCSVKQAAGN
ncbi:MAG: 16S rRNA (adenine(1518)-N(6)/adenine(1519)-N(6))-dimethyltransferase RsmA [Burkholderiales bacterium]|nr:16S rRNA (adenine(1518)-N(6)/adenine(1519)-N(6))-dimethyltransferase RsmA [Pseudomonadota bacterium]